MSDDGHSSVRDLQLQYVGLNAQWVAESEQPGKANTIFRKMHQLAKDLRATPEGRDALVGLLRHETPAVRLNAAAECLAWGDERAVNALQELAPMPGLIAFTAGSVLETYWAGKLNMDW